MHVRLLTGFGWFWGLASPGPTRPAFFGYHRWNLWNVVVSMLRLPRWRSVASNDEGNFLGEHAKRNAESNRQGLARSLIRTCAGGGCDLRNRARHAGLGAAPPQRRTSSHRRF